MKIDPKNVVIGLSLGNLTKTKKESFSVFAIFFADLPTKYSMIREVETERLTPFITCDSCSKVWWMYTKPNDTVRSNSKSNINPHNCTPPGSEQATLDESTFHPLTNLQRQQLSKEIAQILAEEPTVSTHAGVKIANRGANIASKLTMKARKPLKFDLSRQNVSKTQIELGKEIIKSNLQLYEANPSSLIIDHWSSHGRNFIAIIARSIDNGSVKETLIHFAIANDDKSAYGITEDVMPFLKEKTLPVPIISDNCSVIVAMEKYSRQAFLRFIVSNINWPSLKTIFIH